MCNTHSTEKIIVTVTLLNGWSNGSSYAHICLDATKKSWEWNF